MKLYMPVKVYSEKGAVRTHGVELCSLGSKAMIVTGKRSSAVNGSLKDVEDALNEGKVPYLVYNRIEENPSVETAVDAAKLAVAEGVDFFIGVGGGSPMDSAKAIALMAKNTFMMEDARTSLYTANPDLPCFPVAEVPTTSGTGSEVTQYAILTQHDNHTKKSIAHYIFAELALVDATYLHTSSLANMRSTCVDALAHLLESFLNTNSNEYNRVYSREGLRQWGKVKGCLVSEETYGAMTAGDFEVFMHASVLGGMAIAHTSTSLPHGLSYPVTYELGIPHGRALGIFLPGFLKYYENQGDVKEALELLGFSDVEAFAEYIDTVLGKVDIPDDLWESDVDAILVNPAKMKNLPGGISRENLLSYRR